MNVSICEKRSCRYKKAYIEPIDVLVPVGTCDGQIGDVRLLGIIFGIAVWLRRACHGGWLLDVIGVNGLHASHSLVRRHCCWGERLKR